MHDGRESEGDDEKVKTRWDDVTLCELAHEHHHPKLKNNPPKNQEDTSISPRTLAMIQLENSNDTTRQHRDHRNGIHPAPANPLRCSPEYHHQRHEKASVD